MNQNVKFKPSIISLWGFFHIWCWTLKTFFRSLASVQAPFRILKMWKSENENCLLLWQMSSISLPFWQKWIFPYAGFQTLLKFRIWNCLFLKNKLISPQALNIKETVDHFGSSNIRINVKNRFKSMQKILGGEASRLWKIRAQQILFSWNNSKIILRTEHIPSLRSESDERLVILILAEPGEKRCYRNRNTSFFAKIC